MNSPLVSVIIPAFNQADYLGEAIQSVLDQTYPNFEVIVVNDASPDATHNVVNYFDDSRIRYYVHEKNQGLPTARNSGMRASVGEFIALLDADDYFHPEKLETHIALLNGNSDICVSYNARFNLNHSSDTIHSIWRPPQKVGLADFVCGFPFSPSDMVIRRDWAFRVGLFDQKYMSGGEDLDFPCRLALAGCGFARVEKVLNYRRYHSGRRKKNLVGRMSDYSDALSKVFSDPRCAMEVISLKNVAYANSYLEVGVLALFQDDTAVGKEYLLEATKLAPSILDGKFNRLIRYVLNKSVEDVNLRHEVLLQSFFAQLPAELAWLVSQYDWTVAQGYLVKGCQDILWERQEKGLAHLEEAAELGAEFNESLIHSLAKQLLDYEFAFGFSRMQEKSQEIAVCLEQSGIIASAGQLQSRFASIQAFDDYYFGQYDRVVRNALRSVALRPSNLLNRGLMSITTRSTIEFIKSAFRNLSPGAGWSSSESETFD